MGKSTSALSVETSYRKSSATAAGGENISPEKQYCTMSHNTLVKPFYFKRTDYLKSLTTVYRNALYIGLVLLSIPCYASTSGHHTSGDLPSKSASKHVENF